MTDTENTKGQQDMKNSTEIKKEKLETMVLGEKLGEKLKTHKLKIGKNIIQIVDDKGKNVRKKVINYTGEDSLVQKDQQDMTDIKNILQKYGRTGMLPIMQDEELYGDFSNVPDFMEAQNIIIKAEQQFALLSSDVRKKFDNDPAKFLEFCGKEENKEEMIKLGLAKKPLPPEGPTKVEIVNQEPSTKQE